MNLIGDEIPVETLNNLVKDMHQGINTVTEKVEYLSDGVPIIQSKHITKGYLHFNDAKFLSEEAYLKYKEKYQPKIDDLLVCNIGTIGKSLRISDDNPFLIAWNLFLIKIKKDQLFSSFFAHYLNYLADKKYFDRFLTGGTVKFINKKTMGNIPIPLPPLDQQKKIAAILDAADSYKQKTKALIDKYDELTQSLFLDMFGDPVRNTMGWEMIPFSNVATNKNYLRVPIKKEDRENMQGAYPYYGATGIVDYINDYKFDGEFLLVAEDGKNLDNRKKPIAWIARGQFWVNNHSHVVAFNGVANLTFLSYQLNGIDISKYVTGIDQFKMNKSNLNRIPISIPPIELQNQFADRIQAIKAQKALAQDSLVQADNLFNSLLQKAFKGELV